MSGRAAGAGFSVALQGPDCHLEWVDRIRTPLPVTRWRRTADASDRALLAHCVGDTLDVGCGPGRMAEHLSGHGHRVLALDVAPEAVAQATRRGLDAFVGDVFSPLPDEGGWDTALLADGNIGIGGDPLALLARLAQVLRPTGRVVVDLEPPGGGLRTGWVRLHTPDHATETFRWSSVPADAVAEVAIEAGFAGCVVHRHADRWFAVLTRAVT